MCNLMLLSVVALCTLIFQVFDFKHLEIVGDTVALGNATKGYFDNVS